MQCLCISEVYLEYSFFFFNDTATTEIYTLSLHDALPIFDLVIAPTPAHEGSQPAGQPGNVRRRRILLDSHHEGCIRPRQRRRDRKSTRLNSSHANISYAVFCLKKKKHTSITPHTPQ